MEYDSEYESDPEAKSVSLQEYYSEHWLYEHFSEIQNFFYDVNHRHPYFFNDKFCVFIDFLLDLKLKRSYKIKEKDASEFEKEFEKEISSVYFKLSTLVILDRYQLVEFLEKLYNEVA